MPRNRMNPMKMKQVRNCVTNWKKKHKKSNKKLLKTLKLARAKAETKRIEKVRNIMNNI